jgi:hypothetical protein
LENLHRILFYTLQLATIRIEIQFNDFELFSNEEDTCHFISLVVGPGHQKLCDIARAIDEINDKKFNIPKKDLFFEVL